MEPVLYYIFIAIFVVVCLTVVHLWHRFQRSRAEFQRSRAEVVIENLRLWREFIENQLRKYPDEPRVIDGMDVAEQAVFMSMHSENRRAMVAKAWENVKKMHVYLVREYNMGKAASDWQEVRASSEAEAAQKICGSKLLTEGRLGELRAQVRRKGDLSQTTPISFYSDPNEG